MMIRTFNELQYIPTFRDRYLYLKLSSSVGTSTFGFDRHLNQALYTSAEWKRARRFVIIRDNGLDLGVAGHEINDRVIIHHMNPISIEDIEERNSDIFNTNFLICVSSLTHQAIHYSDESLLPKDPIVRRAGDTCPWR